MHSSEWFSIIVLAAGLLMGTLGRNAIRKVGVALLIIGAAGLAWSLFQRDGASEAGNCNISGPNGTINSSCNTTINPIVHDPNGLYQGEEKVGRIQDPSIDEPHNLAKFKFAVFTAFPDPNKPLEYAGLLLNCDDVPKPMPNTFVGTLSASVLGFNCRIVGHK